ncbi:hypothetical protein OROGR_007858 [Orobanche gracilis]
MAASNAGGHLDVDLNDVGRQQAVVVADWLSREPKISSVYSSGLKRAFDTANIIAKICGVPEVTKDPDLRERHLGDLQGVVFHEIANINPEAHKAFVSNRDDQEIPGNYYEHPEIQPNCKTSSSYFSNAPPSFLLEESTLVKMVAERALINYTNVKRRLCKGSQRNTWRVVVVSHGGTIRALHRRASPHRRSSGRVLNTSSNVFHLTGGGEWIVKLWGDVNHLNGAGFLESGFGGDRNSG